MLLLLVGDEALHEAVGHLLAKVDSRSGHVLVDLAAEELDGQVEELDFTLEDAVINGVPINQVPTVVKKEEEKLVKSTIDQNSEKLSNKKTSEDLTNAEG